MMMGPLSKPANEYFLAAEEALEEARVLWDRNLPKGMLMYDVSRAPGSQSANVKTTHASLCGGEVRRYFGGPEL